MPISSSSACASSRQSSPLRRIAHHAPGIFFALGNRDGDVVARIEFAQQRVDLMGARKAAVDAHFRRHRFDRGAFQHGSAPESGCRNPVSRLTNVVLPAPFGPIRPTRAPASRSTSIDCATTSAPKLLFRSRIERAGVGAHAASERLREAGDKLAADAAEIHQPAFQKQHRRDQHAADDEFPEMRADLGGRILHDEIDHGADKCAVEPAGAAEDQHHGHDAGGEQAERRSGRRSASNAPTARRPSRPSPPKSCRPRAAATTPACRSRACGGNSGECRRASGRTANAPAATQSGTR